MASVIKRLTPLDAADIIRKRCADGSVECVFTDVFDTVLFRDLAKPVDLFERLAGGNRMLPLMRKAAERLSYKMFKNPSLEQIHKLFPMSWGCAAELAAEKAAVYAPRALPGMLNELPEHVTVVAVSDMYLSSAEIKDMLAASGVRVGKCYSSSSMGCSKSDGGRLFLEILNELGLKKEKIIHVGDNEHSDLLMGRRSGIESLLVHSPSTWLAEHGVKGFAGGKPKNTDENRFLAVLSACCLDFSVPLVKDEILSSAYVEQIRERCLKLCGKNPEDIFRCLPAHQADAVVK